MASTLAPFPLHFCEMSTNSIRFHPSPNIVHIPRPKIKLRCLQQAMHFHNWRRRPHRVTECGGGGGDESEDRARETVLKFYEAIRNKNVNQLSDMIAEECSCFVSAFRPLIGKKQVLGFFLNLMKLLGNNIEFVVQQTSDDGMVVSVSWKLEWRKVPLRLGKGFSLYTCHVYQGKVMITNVEMFVEPLFRMEPLRLKLMEKLNLHTLLKKRAGKAAIFVVVFVAALVCLFIR